MNMGLGTFSSGDTTVLTRALSTSSILSPSFNFSHLSSWWRSAEC